MIPGTKMIDDILKGLPENARLRSDNTKLASENETLRVQVKNQAVEIQALKDKYESPIRSDAEKMTLLRLLESLDENIQPVQVAQRLGWEVGRTHYLLKEICSTGHADEVPTGFRIEDKGRVALHGSNV
jgi:flagellar motor switch/type III secretory pathway protein FliN